MSLRSLWWLGCWLLSCAGCRPALPTPDEGSHANEAILAEVKMSEVLFDWHLLEADLQLREAGEQTDSIAATYYGWLCQKHNITAQQLMQSLRSYSQRPEALQRLYQGIAAKYQEEMSRSEAIQGPANVRGEVNNAASPASRTTTHALQKLREQQARSE